MSGPGSLPRWLATDLRFRNLRTVHGNDARAAAQLGIELFQAGTLDRAAAALEAAVALDQTQPLYWSNYGVVLNAQGQREKAVEMFHRSLALDPGQFQIWLNLANTLVPLGQRAEAENAFSHAAAHAESAVEAFTGLGLMRMDQSRYGEAAECFAQALQGGGAVASLHGNLGAACFQMGKIEAARAAYSQAAALAPGEAGYRDNLSFLTMLEGVMEGRAEAAVTTYARPLSDDTILVSAFRRALLFLTSFGKIDAALGLIEEWLGYYPDDIEPRYLKAALSGRPLERAPKVYIAAHFDRLAARFDDHFLAALDYHVPEKIAGLVAGILGSEWRGDILDAGCGTGILGAALKGFATTLAGVDLSRDMIERARLRDIYDELMVGDLVDFMRDKPESFDLATAAEVLIYSGALEPVFDAAALCLRARGWLIFDVETQQDAGYSVTPAGRFRHAEEYVRSAAKGRFRVAEVSETMLRREAGSPVQGSIFVLRKI